MIRKTLAILSCTILVQAGILGSDYSPSTSVSYTSFSSRPIITKAVETPIQNPQEIIYERPELSPIYESVLNTQDNKYQFGNGFEQRTFSKSLNTGDSKINKLESRTVNEFNLVLPSPGHTEAIYQSGSYSQESVSPTVYASAPIESSLTSAVSRPLVSISQPPPTYSIGSSPIMYNSKITPGLSAYASVNHDPALINTDSSSKQSETIAYSGTPVTSHVFFTDSKASYSW